MNVADGAFVRNQKWDSIFDSLSKIDQKVSSLNNEIDQISVQLIQIENEIDQTNSSLHSKDLLLRALFADFLYQLPFYYLSDSKSYVDFALWLSASSIHLPVLANLLKSLKEEKDPSINLSKEDYLRITQIYNRALAQYSLDSSGCSPL